MKMNVNVQGVFLFVVLYFARGEDPKEADKKVLEYIRPDVGDSAHFAEPFHSSQEFITDWVPSQAKKEDVDEAIAKYNGEWIVKEPKTNAMPGDHGLVFASEAKHGAIASPLKRSFKFEDKPFFLQYEVRFQKKHECGGAYVKLLTDTPALDVKEFTDKTEYTIMFGPDKCGGDGKLHFIFQHKNPLTHKMEEKHAKKPSGDFSNIFDDDKTHLMTLIIRPDNSYEVLVDKKRVNEGSLLKDVEPPVNPAKEIDDPNDKKPEDWDEREKIPDPDATKPDDWDEDAPKMISDPNAKKPSDWLDDEPELTPDPAAVRPEDWDDEEDGEWEAPQISNPKCKSSGCGEWKAPTIKNPSYKGKWTPPLIANSNYKGIWKPRRIENFNYFEDLNPFAMKPIGAVGFELWSMQSDILFDNIIIADDQATIDSWTAQTWDLKHSEEVSKEPNAVVGMWNSFQEATQEKPWLWVVAIGAILLPLLLIYFFCFPSKEDKAAERKKTDEPAPDSSAAEDSGQGGDDSTEDKIEEPVDPDVETIINEPENTDKKQASEQEEEEAGGKSSDEGNKSEEKEEEKEKLDNASGEEATQSSPSPKTRSRRKTRKD